MKKKSNSEQKKMILHLLKISLTGKFETVPSGITAMLS